MAILRKARGGAKRETISPPIDAVKATLGHCAAIQSGLMNSLLDIDDTLVAYERQVLAQIPKEVKASGRSYDEFESDDIWRRLRQTRDRVLGFLTVEAQATYESSNDESNTKFRRLVASLLDAKRQTDYRFGRLLEVEAQSRLALLSKTEQELSGQIGNLALYFDDTGKKIWAVRLGSEDEFGESTRRVELQPFFGVRAQGLGIEFRVPVKGLFYASTDDPFTSVHKSQMWQAELFELGEQGQDFLFVGARTGAGVPLEQIFTGQVDARDPYTMRGDRLFTKECGQETVLERAIDTQLSRHIPTLVPHSMRQWMVMRIAGLRPNSGLKGEYIETVGAAMAAAVLNSLEPANRDNPAFAFFGYKNDWLERSYWEDRELQKSPAKSYALMLSTLGVAEPQAIRELIVKSASNLGGDKRISIPPARARTMKLSELLGTTIEEFRRHQVSSLGYLPHGYTWDKIFGD